MPSGCTPLRRDRPVRLEHAPARTRPLLRGVRALCAAAPNDLAALGLAGQHAGDDEQQVVRTPEAKPLVEGGDKFDPLNGSL